jgi:hypothetical protein
MFHDSMIKRFQHLMRHPAPRLTGLMAGLFWANAAYAGPVLVGNFQDWDAYRLTDGKTSSCYVISTPKQIDRPPDVNRGTAYFLITLKGAGQPHLEPSLIADYTFHPGSVVKILVGDKRFSMFTKGDGAWVKDANDEIKLVAAMKAGAAMVAQGTTGKNTPLVDHYSTRGLTQALTAIDQACK